MTETIVAGAKALWQGVRAFGRGLRRSIVAVCAVTAMIVIYGLGSIGTYGLSLAGLSTVALTATATTADARRRRRRGGWRRRRRGWGLWIGPRRRRRRRWRRRRRRGIYLYW